MNSSSARSRKVFLKCKGSRKKGRLFPLIEGYFELCWVEKGGGELPEGYGVIVKVVELGIVPGAWSIVMFFSLLLLLNPGLEVWE